MPDCFISYSTKDQNVADLIHAELTRVQQLDVFLAPVSVNPGDEWWETLKANLRTSSCVLFLATKAAFEASFVSIELGIAMEAKKRVFPIVWGIAISDLPKWAERLQTLHLKSLSNQEIRDLGAKVARVVREDRVKGGPQGSEGNTLLVRGIALMESGAYEPAIDLFNQALGLDPLSPAANYYLALASLKGRRPRSLFLSEADAISRYLERACRSANPQAHYFFLWALLKLDFYEAKGFTFEPYSEELFSLAEQYPYHQESFEQMNRHARVEESLREI